MQADLRREDGIKLETTIISVGLQVSSTADRP